jgi:polysaccharide export outer membrane protein
MRHFRLALLAFGLSIGAFPRGADAQIVEGSSGPAYRINPGDELEILVWGDERLHRSTRVLPDGTFAFPLVGQVVGAGRLPSELVRVITAGLQPQYRGQVPQVMVSVKNPSGFQFSVIGKVKGPGTFTPGRYVNALEAISIAGGPNEYADLQNVRIIRKSRDNLQTIRLRLGDVLRGNGVSSGFSIPILASGDTLIVP